MSKLKGKTAVITGANSGIGLATAKAFLEAGAERVYLTGRRQVELDRAVGVLGERAIAVKGDVTKPADLDRLHDLIKKEVGHLDVVFANAGFASAAPLGSITAEHFDPLWDTNVKGVVWTVQKMLPLVRAGGSIILTGSIVGSKGFGGWSIYSATKAAVRSFARTWASDLKGQNIRVNVVSPGVIETPGYDQMGTKEENAGFFGFAASITPLGRTGRDDEIAKVATFLASDESSFMSGAEVFVDGGLAQV